MLEHLHDLCLLVLLNLVEKTEELWCNHILSHFLLLLKLEVLQNSLANVDSNILRPLASNSSVEVGGDDTLGYDEVVVLEGKLVHHGIEVGGFYLRVLFRPGLDQQSHRQRELEKMQLPKRITGD